MSRFHGQSIVQPLRLKGFGIGTVPHKWSFYLVFFLIVISVFWPKFLYEAVLQFLLNFKYELYLLLLTDSESRPKLWCWHQSNK